ncbi:hypothetical protein OSB04_009415 [Centaurea solstitialis]|uniref:Reverse transcriptase zinc-binding domain-containing protein n=1 Tax=Centaurea solstitialis TaxID=347529 RepID=A0AA38TGG9_9ASTR|nr:hypothetical protein OSB04_009415 [Centaurea solstitialis]
MDLNVADVYPLLSLVQDNRKCCLRLLQKDFLKVNIPIQSWFQPNGLTSNPDREWNWALDPSGIYTASSLRRAFDDFYLQTHLNSLFQWNSWIPSKVNILVWRISHCRLPTKPNLEKRGVPLVSLSCPLCNNCDESEDHLFRDCSFSNLILQKLCSWWNIDFKMILDHPRLFDWADVLSYKGDKKRLSQGFCTPSSGLFGKLGTTKFSRLHRILLKIACLPISKLSLFSGLNKGISAPCLDSIPMACNSVANRWDWVCTISNDLRFESRHFHSHNR